MMMMKSIAGWLAATTLSLVAAAAGTCAHAQGAPATPAPPAPPAPSAPSAPSAPPALSAPSARPAAAAPQTPAQRMFGDVNPKLAELTDTVLFGDVWARPGLSPRDRSLVTISALIAMNRPDQFRSHLARARDNGVTEAEAIEAITHLAFYAGWPSAVTASIVAKEVFQQKK